MKPLLFNLYTDTQLATSFSRVIKADIADLIQRQFPDGETYLQVITDCKQRDIVILINLHQPDSKLLPLIFLCDTLRDMDAKSIKLVSPYLPYMRQDIRFHAGEALTSRTFAHLLSNYIDTLITIDPHLHRYHHLEEIYSVKSYALQATPLIAEWVKGNVEKPLVVGPDSESEQWAAAAAAMIDCPYLILEKQRFGDKNVKVSAPNAQRYLQHTPVLIDDIISTGRTMIRTSEALEAEGLKQAICIAVHALFSDDAYQLMRKAPIAQIISCNTVPHESNGIDISSLLCEPLL